MKKKELNYKLVDYQNQLKALIKCEALSDYGLENDRGPYLSNEALDVDEMKYPDVIYATEKKCHICRGKGKINVGDADAPDIIICPECSGKGHLA